MKGQGRGRGDWMEDQLEQLLPGYQRWPRKDGPPADPFPLIADVDLTTLDPWFVYNGAGQVEKQGPRWEGNTELAAGGGLVLHTRPMDHDVTVWPDYTIKAGEYAAAGIALKGDDRTYGAWEITTAAMPSKGTRVACALWPADDEHTWPPELDFHEMGGDPDYAGRQASKISNWWQAPDGSKPPPHAERKVTRDFTLQHTHRVEWTPGLYRVLIDGSEVWSTADNVPGDDMRMHLVIQTAIEGGSPAKDGTEPGELRVSAVRTYAWAP